MALQLAKSDDSFQKAATVFNSENASKEDIIAAGEQACTREYIGQKSDSLLDLRVRLFEHKVCKSIALCGQKLFLLLLLQ